MRNMFTPPDVKRPIEGRPESISMSEGRHPPAPKGNYYPPFTASARPNIHPPWPAAAGLVMSTIDSYQTTAVMGTSNAGTTSDVQVLNGTGQTIQVMAHIAYTTNGGGTMHFSVNGSSFFSTTAVGTTATRTATITGTFTSPQRHC